MLAKEAIWNLFKVKTKKVFDLNLIINDHCKMEEKSGSGTLKFPIKSSTIFITAMHSSSFHC